MADRPIFRQAALERLSSPERLDELLHVTHPRAWFALVALTLVVAAAVVWGFVGRVSSRVLGEGILLRSGGPAVAVSPVGGSVTAINVRAGDRIAARAPVVALDTTNGARVVASPITGRVLDVRVHVGQVIAAGTVVARLEPTAGPLTAVAYVAPLDGKSVRPGMRVELLPAHVKAEASGYLIGTVRAVSAFPATQEAMLARLGAKELADRFAAGGPPYEVEIDLTPHPEIADAYRWSSPRRPPVVESGTLCGVRIVARTQRPIDLVIPSPWPATAVAPEPPAASARRP
jgi:pyruvate/2-oxoglutarate dehydrogenase complex dihydrolipoamide acyltransferase (E2) component